jgi:hypothetical protein
MALKTRIFGPHFEGKEPLIPVNLSEIARMIRILGHVAGVGRCWLGDEKNGRTRRVTFRSGSSQKFSNRGQTVAVNRRHGFFSQKATIEPQPLVIPWARISLRGRKLDRTRAIHFRSCIVEDVISSEGRHYRDGYPVRRV